MASLGNFFRYHDPLRIYENRIDKVHVLLLGRPRYFRDHMNQSVHLMATEGVEGGRFDGFLFLFGYSVLAASAVLPVHSSVSMVRQGLWASAGSLYGCIFSIRRRRRHTRGETTQHKEAAGKGQGREYNQPLLRLTTSKLSTVRLYKEALSGMRCHPGLVPTCHPAPLFPQVPINPNGGECGPSCMPWAPTLPIFVLSNSDRQPGSLATEDGPIIFRFL